MTGPLVDSAAHDDWVAELEADLGRYQEAAEPELRLVQVGSQT